MSRFFSGLLQVFFLALFVVATAPKASFAADLATYNVEGVTVNVSGKSPTAARAAATATARRDAFLILLTRLDLKTNVADRVNDDEISDMVRSEQIDGEKIAGSNYSATFNITFAKDFVDHILEQKDSKNSFGLFSGQSKNDENYLLIPTKTTKAKKVILWEEENDWKKALAKQLAKKSLKNFSLPEADVDNLATLNRDNVSSIEFAGLEPMLSRYKSDAAYLLSFFYDDIENKVTISVSYLRKYQKKQIKLSFINVDRLSYQELVDKVASKTLEYLSSQNSPSAKATSSQVKIGIPVDNLGNWLMIKNKIENSGLISQLNVEALSSDFVTVSLTYLGDDIVSSFSKIDISLKKKSENFYVVK